MNGNEEWHGTEYGYTGMGCRLECCRAANTRACARRRADRHRRMLAGEIQVEHGKHGTYVNYGCHCDACTAANTKYNRDKKKA